MLAKAVFIFGVLVSGAVAGATHAEVLRGRDGGKDIIDSADHKRMRRAPRPLELDVDVDLSVVINLFSTADDKLSTITDSLTDVLNNVETLDPSSVEQTVTTQTQKLTSIVKNLHSGLENAGGSAKLLRALSKRQSNQTQEVAQTVTNVLQDLADTANTLESIAQALPIVGPIVSELTTILNPIISQILGIVNNLVSGVLTIVADLLGDLDDLPLVGPILGGLLSEVGGAVENLLGGLGTSL